MTSSYKDCPQSDGLQLETARSPLAHLLKKEPGFMRLWNGIDETGRVEIRETGCCQSHRIKAPTSPEPAKNRQSVRMRFRPINSGMLSRRISLMLTQQNRRMSANL